MKITEKYFTSSIYYIKDSVLLFIQFSLLSSYILEILLYMRKLFFKRQQR